MERLYLQAGRIIGEKPINSGKALCQNNMGFIEQIKHYFEKHAFGVCSALGEKLGIATSSIRLFFIYTSFLTLGSPIIIYLSLAFIMNMRAHLRKRSTIWDF